MNDKLYCVDIYTVANGDTLYSISEKYDLPVSLLMKVNKIKDPYNLQIGTKLCIPGEKDKIHKPITKPKPMLHIVKPGDTLYLIAKQHNVSLDEIMDNNPEIDPYNLLIGTKLIIKKS